MAQHRVPALKHACAPNEGGRALGPCLCRADSAQIPPELRRKVLHILHSASQCSAAPIAVGDRAALASVARWAQGKPEVVAMLLRRLRLPPHHHFFAMHGVRLAARLASVSPPLFEELKKGGMRPAIQAMQASPSCR